MSEQPWKPNDVLVLEGDNVSLHLVADAEPGAFAFVVWYPDQPDPARLVFDAATLRTIVAACSR